MELDPVPVAILLVKDGSRGDKLLFKYPYCTVHEDEYYYETLETNETQEGSRDEQESGPNRTDAVVQEQELEKNDVFLQQRNPFAYTDPDSDPFAATESQASNIDKNGQLSGFSDKAISNLLSVKNKMCNGRFELQVNDVRFVGHPMLIDSGKTSLQKFHLAFVLNAGLDPEVVDGYYSLVQRLAVGLEYMDQIKRYLTEQVTAMLTAHEEATGRAMSDETPLDPYDHIASSNELAQQLITIFNKLCSTGECTTNLGNWFNVSFVMPHKVYANLPVGKYFNFPRMCRRRRHLLRYMSVLLLRERTCFQVPGEKAPQFPLVTPSIKRVLDVTSATSTLYKTAADADIVYDHLVDIVGHFAHWGMMMVIYPVCNKNLYVLSSKAIDIITSHNLQKAYKKRFPHSNVTLQQQLQRFNTPITPEELTEMATTLEHKYEGFFSILWLLECGLITQVHKYVYISVPVGCNDKRTRRFKARDSLRPARAKGEDHKRDHAMEGKLNGHNGSETNIHNDPDVESFDGRDGTNPNVFADLEAESDKCSNIAGTERRNEDGTDAKGSNRLTGVSEGRVGDAHRGGCTERRRRVGRTENLFALAKRQEILSEKPEGVDFDSDGVQQRNRLVLLDSKIKLEKVLIQNSQCTDDQILSAETDKEKHAAVSARLPTLLSSESVESIDSDKVLGDTIRFDHDSNEHEHQEKSDRDRRIWSEQKEKRKKGQDGLIAKESEDDNGSTVQFDAGHGQDLAEQECKRNKKSVSWGKPRSGNLSSAASTSTSVSNKLSSSSPDEAIPTDDINGVNGRNTKNGPLFGTDAAREASSGLVIAPRKAGPKDTMQSPVPTPLRLEHGTRLLGGRVGGLMIKRSRGTKKGLASKVRRGRDQQTSPAATASMHDGVSARSSGRVNGGVGTRGSAGGKGSGTSPGGQESGSTEEEELLSLVNKARLTFQERCAALTIYSMYPDTISFKDMKTFLRLTEFFRGEHHIEEIMYTANLGRGTILDVIDKFSLMLCVTEGPARNYPIVVD